MPQTAVPTEPSQRGRVLVIDDEAIAYQTVQRLLETEGHRIDCASGGVEALAKLGFQGSTAPEEIPYDLLICDLRMPDMDGLELCERVRQSAGAPPVMILTGYATMESAARAVNAGARGYFTKPIQDVANFRAQVRAAVEATQVGQHNRQLFADLVLGRVAGPAALPLDDPQLVERIMQAVHGGICVVDQHGRIRYATVAVAQLLGEAYRRLVGASLGRYVAEADQGKLHDLLAQLAGGRVFGEATVTLGGPAARTRTVCLRAAPVHFQQRFYAAVLTVTDVTEFAAMRDRCAFLTDVIERTDADMLFVIRPNGQIIECNEATRTILGYPRNELLSHTIDALLYSDVPAHWHRIMTVLATHCSWRGTMTARAHGGRAFPVEVTIRRPRGGGGTPGVLLCCCHDISEQKALDRLKDDFIAAVSHELRTPLCILQGAVDNLLIGVAGPLTDAQRAVAATAERSCARLGRLIVDLLELSQLESGRVMWQPQPVPVRCIVEEAVAASHAEAMAKGVEVAVEVPESMPRVSADPQQLAAVLHRLIENAVRFAERRVAIRVRRTGDTSAAGGMAVQISVVDDGLGVPLDQMDQLFAKFGQVSRPIGPGYHGIGLGLAICKEIVERHRGTIWAERGTPHGMVFYLRLPAESGGARE